MSSFSKTVWTQVNKAIEGGSSLEDIISGKAGEGDIQKAAKHAKDTNMSGPPFGSSGLNGPSSASEL